MLRLLRLRLILLCRLGLPLRLLGGPGGFLRLLLRMLGLLRLRLLLSRFGLPLRLLSGLRVLLRLRLLLLSWLGPLPLLRRLTFLFFRRLCLAFLLLRGQNANRRDNQKRGDGTGRSNKLHSLVST
jgi:hypothetical protein